MVRLLDANVLIYALNSDAPEHDKVVLWLELVYSHDSHVLIPVASAHAFLRLATNPRAFPKALSLNHAFKVLKPILHHPKTRCPEPGSEYWRLFERIGTQGTVIGGRLSDVHFAALALEHGATLCSTDRHFRRFPELRLENPLD
ncbi:MAG: TA system VapC family ribonuclease toxin [Fimbriimonadaceae bacterium]